MLAGFYLVALLAAAWIGYSLGRWTESSAVNLAGINNQLAIETLAWREGDAALYASTLHPEADSAWHQSLMNRFASEAPRSLTVRASDMDSVSAGEATVTVVVTAGKFSSTEERRYVVSGNSWFRRDPR